MSTIPKFRILPVPLIFYTLIIISFSLSSCRTALLIGKASIDRSTVKENGPSSYDEEHRKSYVGLNLGILAVVTFKTQDMSSNAERVIEKASHFQLLGGLEFIQKGFKQKFDADDKTTVRLSYLELPLTALYTHRISKGNLFAGAGPYFAYGVGGKSKYTSGGNSFSYPSFGKVVNYKRFDAGLNIIAGYKFHNGFAVSLGCDVGLVSIEDNDDNKKTYNRTFSFNLSYDLVNITRGMKN